MASELLKTFQKIDDSRKVMIERAKLLGHNVDDKASFIELAGTITPAPEITSYPVSSTWDRPKEWPDGKKMIRDNVERDGMFPGAFLMIKSDDDTFTIPNVITSMSNSSSHRRIGAHGYLTSDGTWYNDATENITHTWDKTKDIIIEDGEYAGTYRWLLCYYDPNQQVQGYLFLLQYMPIAEIIIGYINAAYVSSGVGGNLLISYSSNGYPELVNLEILPESNYIGGTWGYGNSWYCARDLKKVRNLDLGTMVNLGGSSIGTVFTGLDKLKHFNAPKLTNLYTNTSGSNATLNINSAPNLESLVYGGTRTVIIGKPTYNLTKLHAPNSIVAFVGSQLNYMYPVYLRNDIDLDVGYIAGGSIPLNWTSTKGVCIAPGIANSITTLSSSSGSQHIAMGHPNLVTIDLTDSILLNTTKVTDSNKYFMFVGKYSPKLREVIIPENFEYRLDLEYTDLTHSCLVSMLNNLKDLTNVTSVYDPNLKLGKQNLDKLSEDEIKIATDKGWGVIE